MIALALVPAVVLLIYIYKKDKREKEPMRLLWKCFFLGIISTLPAILIEELGEMLLDSDLTEGSFSYAFIDSFVVVALAEELCKYVMLKKSTWKSSEFNCYFDGIVYAVFVSLGFAALENIFYVLDGGLSTAIMRMFTAVPLHAFTAVFMGYYYSRAKGEALKGNNRKASSNRKKALWVPLILHGFYDSLLSLDSDVVGDSVTTVSIIVWIVFVIIMFIRSIKLVKKASAQDDYFDAE